MSNSSSQEIVPCLNLLTIIYSFKILAIADLIRLLVLDSTFKIFYFDFNQFAWAMAIDTHINKEQFIDTSGSTPQAINRDFGVNLGFDNYIYFPAGALDNQSIWQCHLKTAKCNIISLENYWNTF